jgi:AhpD family alkylhydroperoxidase
MVEGHHELLEHLRAPTKALRKAIPDVWDGFLKMHSAAVADGVVPAPLKESAALAIAVVKGCEGCIAYHAKAAAKAGASPDEVAEMLGIAVLMDGGTATVYAPHAWEAFTEFAAGDDARRSTRETTAGVS